eukprot:TRINITY_DN14349_c0_g1_i1.p1 TRINITY_DN14349_c0_g1~~TRINITY_DN14349_c0_g1_i1.p1  ORF type:complete len:284 (+),score=71.58 TRINITY_DN14349_c0_g1_i1:180-1031(+)
MKPNHDVVLTTTADMEALEREQSDSALKTRGSPGSAASTSTSPGGASSSSTDGEEAECRLSSSQTSGSTCHPLDSPASSTYTDESEEEDVEDEEDEESEVDPEEPKETALIDGFLQMAFAEDFGTLLKTPVKYLPMDVTAELACDFDETDKALRKLILLAIRFLVTYGYTANDICCVLVYSCVYFRKANAKLKLKTPREAGYIMVLLMYLAHSYVLDEHCAPKAWHKRLFAEYCDMPQMDKAVVSLMRVLSWKLKVEHGLVEKMRKHLVLCYKAAGSSGGFRP